VSRSASSSFSIAGCRHIAVLRVCISSVSVADIKYVWTVFGTIVEICCRSASWPYDNTRSASSMTKD
jgi:hypothetical protein